MCCHYLKEVLRIYILLLSCLTIAVKVEVYLTGKRLEEEMSLLKMEMVQFLCYCKDNLIPDLSSRLNSLKESKNGLNKGFPFV